MSSNSMGIFKLDTKLVEPVRTMGGYIQYALFSIEKGWELVALDSSEAKAARSNPANLTEEVLSLSPWNESVFENGDDVDDVEELINSIRHLLEDGFQFRRSEEALFIACYLISTWVFDEYDAVNYLAFVGIPGSGKSELLKATHYLAYNSVYFSGLASISSIFRTIDMVKGTLAIDESQRSTSDVGGDFHKLMAVGNQKLGNVTRSAQKGRNLDFTTETFSVFGPKITSGRSTPGDEAILSRTHAIYLEPLTLDEVLASNRMTIDSKEWQDRAATLRARLLKFRMRRKVGVQAPPALNCVRQLLPKGFNPRNYQSYRWILNEIPSQYILKIVIGEISRNLKRMVERREEQTEPAILIAAYDLVESCKGQKVYMMHIAHKVERETGSRVSPRQVSQVLSLHGIEKRKGKEGLYVVSNANRIGEKIVSLGLSDPRNSSTSSLQSTDSEDSDSERKGEL
jgi:hypothetical protein